MSEVSDAVRMLETSNAYLQRDLDAARAETREAKELVEQERKRNKVKLATVGRLISYYRAGLLEAKQLLAMEPGQGSIQVIGAAKIETFMKEYAADPARLSI